MMDVVSCLMLLAVIGVLLGLLGILQNQHKEK